MAFAVFALTTAAVMGSVGNRVNSSRVSERHAIATLIAESKLAAAGIDAPLGDASGETRHGFGWRTTAWPRPTEGGDDRVAQANRPYDVRVVVSWSNAKRDHAIELNSVRYGPGD